MTRYQQRRYAEQLKTATHRPDMEKEAGSAFAHYIRTDRSGARPIPPELMDRWIDQGWIAEVAMPARPQPPDPIPATVLDPFSGAGTTGLVAQRLGRSYIGLELNPKYAEMSRQRIHDDRYTKEEIAGIANGQTSMFDTDAVIGAPV